MDEINFLNDKTIFMASIFFSYHFLSFFIIVATFFMLLVM